MNDSLDELLDARLRDEITYIDDAGFTAGVMKRLPRRNAVRTQRSIIIFSAAILSVLTAYVASGEGSFVHDLVARIAGMPPIHLLVATIVCGLATTASAFCAAFPRLRETSE